MTTPQPESKRLNILPTLASLIIPGLGQVIRGAYRRGVIILLTIAGLGSLSVWSIAQRARFPDYVTGLRVFALVLLQSLALLLFLSALRYLVSRAFDKTPELKGFLWPATAVLYFIAILSVGNILYLSAGTTANLAKVYPSTTIFSAAAMAALWLWQAVDAGQLGPKPNASPGMANAILIASLLIFVLGYSIVGIDLPKAIREYQQVGTLMDSILWPWRNAFEFEQLSADYPQSIMAPCPEGVTPPEPNTPSDDEPWISVTPTCADLSVRQVTGGIEFGTELTIRGGNFTPGVKLIILWKNPIGNPFVPRGMGDTEIIVGSDGTFETTLFTPDLIIPSTAEGNQVHSLVVRNEGELVFTGHLSREIKLALQGMLETIMMALMATLFGIVLAFPLSFLAARNLMAPIVTTFNNTVGGTLGLAVGVIGGGMLTQLVGRQIGGLEANPIPVFLIGTVFVLSLGALGMRLGGWLFDLIYTSLGKSIATAFDAFALAALLAYPGYIVGRFINHNVMSIPIDPAIVAEKLPAYGMGGMIGGVVLGLILALVFRAEGEIRIGYFIYGAVRTVLNIIRSIEPIIWAIIATIWVGLGAFAGTIALTVHTVAALGKLYSESIESIDDGPLEALQATGANRLQTILYAVVPQIMPPYISFTIYRWDINVRMSTIIGAVGGGGIGFLLIQWIRQFQYRNAGLAVWLIAITVSTLDYVSSNIRERYV